MDRYATLLFPGLALLAGFSVARVLSQGPAWRRALIGAPIAAALGWSLIACLAVDRVLAGDPRYAAAEWLDRNASVGSRVAMDRYGPWLDRTRYRVALLEQDSAMQEDDYRTRVRLRECGSCERIRSAIFEAERRIGWALGRSSDRKRYTTWFDSLVERIDSERIRPPDLLDADYVLLLPHRKPVTMKRLAAPGSGYELVANFPAPRPFGMRPPFSFIGRPVEIYARKAP